MVFLSLPGLVSISSRFGCDGIVALNWKRVNERGGTLMVDSPYKGNNQKYETGRGLQYASPSES